MDAKELIDETIKKLEPVTDPKLLRVLKTACERQTDKFQDALDTYYPPEELLDDKIEEYVQKVVPDGDEELKEEVRVAFRENYYGKEPLKDTIGLGEDELNIIYTIAFNYYNHGRYAQAQPIFQILTVLKNDEPDYYFGFAACQHMQKEYANAIPNYLACAYLDFYNPIPWFHLADCYMHYEAWAHALIALGNVKTRVTDTETFGPIIKKTDMLLDAVMNKMSERGIDPSTLSTFFKK